MLIAFFYYNFKQKDISNKNLGSTSRRASQVNKILIT